MPAFAAGCAGEAMNAALSGKMTHTTLNSRRTREFPASGVVEHLEPGSARRPGMDNESKWKHRGVRVVHANELDINTAQTPGMNRAAAITNARAGAEKLWAGTVVIDRKSTRLNSSHRTISYAVFCLKKKKPTPIHTTRPASSRWRASR